jgi:DNA (cytosine-5)-methyltransferase 1
MTGTIVAADLFCGAGGSSTGLALAAESAGRGLDLTAVNHWDRAIETHSANHPAARHLCHDLDDVNPTKAVGRKIDLLIASPECTHHSNARGAKPMQDQSRSTAWHVIRWAEALQPRFVLVENVREFQTWGPLSEKGKPLAKRKGETFQAWAQALRSLGYVVDWRVLNAADYGAATSRQRLFVMARRGRGPMPWPDPTHAREAVADLFGRRERWRAAREVIDWSLPCPSIFGRKRPLRENTLRRIEAGLKKFGGANAEPFLVAIREGINRRVHLLDEPIPTITAGQKIFGIVQPRLLQLTHGGRMLDAADPLPTVTGAHRGEIGLVQPFVIPTNYGERQGQTPRTHDVDEPLPTIVGTTAHGVCQPFLVPYYGTGLADDTGEPVRTLTARDRLALVTPDGVRCDIGFRMLQPHEMAAAMGFPKGFRFSGSKKEVVKQIGNAVEVRQARALCEAILQAL